MLVAACGTTSSSKSSPSQSGNVDAKQEGRRLTSAFYGGHAAEIWQRLTPEMKKAIGSEERLATLSRQIEDQLGTEAVIVSERTRDFWHPNGSAAPSQSYQRVARFSKANQLVVVDWMFEPNGEVSSFAVKPAQ